MRSIDYPNIEHPAFIIASARTAIVPLEEPGYSCGLITLIEEANRWSADDASLVNNLIQTVIVTWQDAALRRIEAEDTP